MEKVDGKWIITTNMDAQRKVRERERQNKIREERAEIIGNILYFLEQKVIGMILVVLSVWVSTSEMFYDAALGGNDCTVTLILVPLGLLMMFSEKRWILG